MDYEARFMSLDNQNSCCEKVDMPKKIVFYPYFHFKPAKSTSKVSGGGTDNAYRTTINLSGFDAQRLAEIEKQVQGGRCDEYGFWTIKNAEGFYIGPGARCLIKALDHLPEANASYVLLKGTDIVFIFSLEKNGGTIKYAKLEVYFSDANSPYGEKAKSVSGMLSGLGIKPQEEELKSELTPFHYKKYLYHEGEKDVQKQKNHLVFPAHKPASFLSNVCSCTWHTTVVNDDVVNDGPHYVLVKNCGLSLGNILDETSSWLVHRRGGFVMGKEFASNDFDQDTTFSIREVDEYEIGDLTILNVECDTYSKNQDTGFEKFLKSISASRFIK